MAKNKIVRINLTRFWKPGESSQLNEVDDGLVYVKNGIVAVASKVYGRWHYFEDRGSLNVYERFENQDYAERIGEKLKQLHHEGADISKFFIEIGVNSVVENFTIYSTNLLDKEKDKSKINSCSDYETLKGLNNYGIF